VMAWWHLDWALNRLVLEAPRTQRRGNQPGKYI
jgi:hypothetical protein